MRFFLRSAVTETPLTATTMSQAIARTPIDGHDVFGGETRETAVLLAKGARRGNRLVFQLSPEGLNHLRREQDERARSASGGSR